MRKSGYVHKRNITQRRRRPLWGKDAWDLPSALNEKKKQKSEHTAWLAPRGVRGAMQSQTQDAEPRAGTTGPHRTALVNS